LARINQPEGNFNSTSTFSSWASSPLDVAPIIRCEKTDRFIQSHEGMQPSPHVFQGSSGASGDPSVERRWSARHSPCQHAAEGRSVVCRGTFGCLPRDVRLFAEGRSAPPYGSEETSKPCTLDSREHVSTGPTPAWVSLRGPVPDKQGPCRKALIKKLDFAVRPPWTS
jgi:hypothetical protein